MVKRKKEMEVKFISIQRTSNENIFTDYFKSMYFSFENILLNLFEAVKRESIFLCAFSCSVLFLLAWVVSAIYYVLFIPVLIFSIIHLANEHKLFLIKKDFDENGIF
ncbi:MAG: hypothetical protein WC821_02400 [archaeon]